MTASNPVARKTPPKVDLDTTREKLTKLGMLHASEHVGETLAEAVKESWPPHRFLDLGNELRRIFLADDGVVIAQPELRVIELGTC